METTSQDIECAKGMESLLFPADEPWLSEASSRALARQCCVEVAKASRLGLDLAKEAGLAIGKAMDFEAPYAQAIGERVASMGAPVAQWLAGGESRERFEMQRAEFEEAAARMGDGLLEAGVGGLSKPVPEWLAKAAGWAHAMAAGPMSGLVEAQSLLWSQISRLPGSPMSPGQTEHAKGMYETGLDPEKTQQHQLCVRAYHALGIAPREPGASKGEWVSAASQMRAIVFPPEEGWESDPIASAFVDRACRIVAQSVMWAQSGAAEADKAMEFEARATALLSHEMPSEDEKIEDSCVEALGRAQTLGRKVADWLAKGGSLEAFESLCSDARAYQKPLLLDHMPKMLGGEPADVERFERARDWCARAAARARALADGPCADTSAGDLLWSASSRALCAFEDSGRKALVELELGSPAASAVRELVSSAIDLSKRRPRKGVDLAGELLETGVIGFVKMVEGVVSGDYAAKASEWVAGAFGKKQEAPEVVAARIKSRFGFAAVLVDGAKSSQAESMALRGAEQALAEAALRLGVADFELGRKGGSTLTLSANRLRSRMIAGYCNLSTGNITLSNPADASTIVHEWAHSVDALAAKASGFESGTLTDQAPRASLASVDKPGVKAVEALAEALRGLGSDGDAHRCEGEQARLGRLMAAKIAMKVLGRAQWASLPEGPREAYLREASEPAFGVVASGAMAIRQFELERAEAPRDGVREAEEESARRLARRVDSTVGLAREGQGGYLGVNARRLAGLLEGHFGAKADAALEASVRELGEDGLGLGRQALAAGEPAFSASGVGKLVARRATAYDAAQALQNGMLSRSSSNPQERSSALETGYFAKPSEILARSVERFTATSAGELLLRSARMMLSPTTKADGERFKQAWGELLAVAGIEARPGGMRLANAPKALDGVLSALGSPIRSVLLSGHALHEKISQKRALAMLSQGARQTMGSRL